MEGVWHNPHLIKKWALSRIRKSYEQGKRDCEKEIADKEKKKWRAYSKKSYRKNRERILQHQHGYQHTIAAKKLKSLRDKEQRKTFRQKVNTRVRTYMAIKQGKLEKLPCQVCGDKKSEAHHPDYSNHLLIIWLCNKHHKMLEGNWVLPASDEERKKIDLIKLALIKEEKP